MANGAKSYTTNGRNQYTAAAGGTITYDANGNLTGDGTWTYTYDLNNRLKTANRASPATAITMAYDAEGRMRSTSTSASQVTQRMYDGHDLVAEYNNSGVLQARYVHGPGVDEPLVTYTSTNVATRSWLYADHVGSIVAQASAAGANNDINKYGPFGEPHTATGGTKFRFTGQQMLGHTALSYYKARFYSPAQGRFLQTDPIGSVDDMNLYAYVSNNPVNKVDPTGEFGVVGAVVGGGLDLGAQLLMNGGDLSAVRWTDVGLSMVGGALTGGLANGNFALKTGSTAWKSAVRPWLTKHWNLPKGQHVHHAIIEQNSRIGKMVPTNIKNQPWNLTPMPSREFHQFLHNLDPVTRTVLGAPGYAQGVAAGGAVAVIGGFTDGDSTQDKGNASGK